MGNREEQISMETIGANVRRLRLQRGIYSQRELAPLVGVSDETISRIERGDVFPKLSTLAALAKALHTTTDEIMGIEPADAEPYGPPPPPSRALRRASLPRLIEAVRNLNKLADTVEHDLIPPEQRPPTEE